MHQVWHGAAQDSEPEGYSLNWLRVDGGPRKELILCIVEMLYLHAVFILNGDDSTIELISVMLENTAGLHGWSGTVNFVTMALV